ncbi:MAG: hypothetical protein AAF993_21085 [Pseudomonadota bacterium]
MTRAQIQHILQQWQAGAMDELAVWQWGEQARQDYREQGGGDDELTRDILDLLAALPYEMLVVEDATVLLDALANPRDETDLSVNLLWNHMDSVEVDTRREVYAQHPFYGQFNDAD